MDERKGGRKEAQTAGAILIQI
jgi:hypothetical protein